MEVNMQTIEAGWYDVPNHEYHTNKKYRDFMTHSGVQHFKRSPKHWRHWRNSKSAIPTPAMNFGSAFHSIAMGSIATGFLDDIEVIPGFNLATKKGKQQYELITNTNPDAIPISPEDQGLISDMCNEMFSNPYVDRLFNMPGLEFEKTGIAYIYPGDCPVMVRPDLMSRERAIVVDLKTTTNAHPGPFTRAVVNYGYHHQAYLYNRVFEVLEHKYPRFIIIAVEKEEPFGVSLFTFSENQLQEMVAPKLNPHLLHFSDCLKNDRWPCYATTPQTVFLPQWA
jgi:exodeoxyribonuclease VIII